MRITEKGQVTIPKELRDQLGLTPDTEVEFTVVGDSVRIRRAADQKARGRSLVESMRGRGDGRLSTDQIMALTRGRGE